MTTIAHLKKDSGDVGSRVSLFLAESQEKIDSPFWDFTLHFGISHFLHGRDLKCFRQREERSLDIMVKGSVAA